MLDCCSSIKSFLKVDAGGTRKAATPEAECWMRLSTPTLILSEDWRFVISSRQCSSTWKWWWWWIKDARTVWKPSMSNYSAAAALKNLLWFWRSTLLKWICMMANFFLILPKESMIWKDNTGDPRPILHNIRMKSSSPGWRKQLLRSTSKGHNLTKWRPNWIVFPHNCRSADRNTKRVRTVCWYSLISWIARCGASMYDKHKNRQILRPFCWQNIVKNTRSSSRPEVNVLNS